MTVMERRPLESLKIHGQEMLSQLKITTKDRRESRVASEAA